MAALIGRPVQDLSARVDGFSRHPVRGECFPGMKVHSGASVEGVCYSGILSSELPFLDWFESDLYERCRISIQCESNDSRSELSAWAYVVPSCRAGRLDEQSSWSYERFIEEDFSAYIDMCRGCREHFEGAEA